MLNLLLIVLLAVTPVGVKVGDWGVIFGAESGADFEADIARLIVCDLVPGGRYRVTIDGGQPDVYTASESGVIYIVGEMHSVSIQPAEGPGVTPAAIHTGTF